LLPVQFAAPVVVNTIHQHKLLVRKQRLLVSMSWVGVSTPRRSFRRSTATAPTRESAPAGLLQGNGGTFKVAAPNAGCRANRVDWKSTKVLPASLAPVRRRGSFWTPLSKLRSYERNY